MFEENAHVYEAPEPQDIDELSQYMLDTLCPTVDDCCMVEHDGVCEHGSPSIFLSMGLI